MNAIFTKAKMITFLLGFLLTMQGFFSLEAQVTVGAGIQPEKGAVLELKEKNALNPSATDISSLENSEKGILFPKVSLKASNQLTPLYGGVDQGNGEWTDLSTDEEKLLATGMIVYNINENAKDMDEGLFVWRIEEWLPISGGSGNAVFDPVDCSSIKAIGAYVESDPVTFANYLSISLNVVKAGAYAISATTGNGYSFYISGFAMEVGQLIVNVPAQGTPKQEQIDKLTFSGIEIVQGCEPEVIVVSSVGTYSLLCNSAVVNGQYLKDAPLSATNFITMNMNVSAAGSYSITTPVKNGISFSASGYINTVGTHTIKLIGIGTPSINEDFDVDITANTPSGNSECNVKIPITLPPMTFSIIGRDVYSWNTPARLKALGDGTPSSSFGPNGVVRMISFKQLWEAPTASDAINRFTNIAERPDVVLYFAHGAPPNIQLTNILIEYINKGGTVIYASEDNSEAAVNILMNGIFGMQTAVGHEPTVGGDTEDNVYEIANIPSDPIINGPFGKLSNRHWGDDNTSFGTVYMTSLPANSVQICQARSPLSPALDPQASIVWYNATKNFVFLGDSTGATYDGNQNSNEYPTIYNSTTGLPSYKNYGRPGRFQYVFNAALELNAVAWAIKRAAVSGINPH